MPILYVNFDEQYNCLKKDPYLEFTKKFNNFKDNLNEKEFEIKLGDGKNCGNFSNGFYTDNFYCKSPSLSFKFANTNQEPGSTFLRMTYSYEYEDAEELEYHFKKIQALKLRIPYLYLPNITYFDFNFQMDTDKLNWNFDVVIPDSNTILTTCYSLISTIVSLFAFDE